MNNSAIVLANGRYQSPNGKVAHGLVRGSDRFSVVAVIEPELAGRDAGDVLDGVHRGIPIVASIDEAIACSATRPAYCIVGIATHGGHLSADLRILIREAITKGLSIVNGLHDAASDDPEIAAAAAEYGVELIDIRKPKSKSELHFWEGDVRQVRAKRMAILGTDCALGKRTTTRLLVEALCGAGVKAEMIYTGQTGWMQGARYGFVLDSVINDYVSGELEHALVTCDREAQPELMVIEGQSSLRNPSGPCGAEFLLSGGATKVILQHAVGREFFDGYEQQGYAIPPIEDEIALIKFYGADTIAVTMNTRDATPEQTAEFKADYEQRLNIPVIQPLNEGLGALLPGIQQWLAEE